MSRRMQRDQGVVADRDTVAFVNRLPIDSISPVLFRPWVFEEPRAAMNSGDCGHTRRMVGMRVRYQDITKLCVVVLERGGELFEVVALAHTGVNQHGGPMLVDYQIGVIARTGHRARIVRVEHDCVEHVTTVVYGPRRFAHSYSSASTSEPRTAASAGQIAATNAATEFVGISRGVTDTGNS